ncbi:MAG TPA: cupin domain-containing protein [Sediminibacterium sp.]|nr:cupin domain-containing protein [Sediminibacterium sp.]
MHPVAAKWIRQYQLLPHPEGGYYRETYRAKLTVEANALPPGFDGKRQLSTAIYFLLEAGNFSAFHRIKSDECWHFYAGDPLYVHVLDTAGQYCLLKLGRVGEEQFQAIVPAGCWFAAEMAPGGKYALVGCTVSPGFDFADFELASASALSEMFPQHQQLIGRLCRQ